MHGLYTYSVLRFNCTVNLTFDLGGQYYTLLLMACYMQIKINSIRQIVCEISCFSFIYTMTLTFFTLMVKVIFCSSVDWLILFIMINDVDHYIGTYVIKQLCLTNML